MVPDFPLPLHDFVVPKIYHEIHYFTIPEYSDDDDCDKILSVCPCKLYQSTYQLKINPLVFSVPNPSPIPYTPTYNPNINAFINIIVSSFISQLKNHPSCPTTISASLSCN